MVRISIACYFGLDLFRQVRKLFNKPPRDWSQFLQFLRSLFTLYFLVEYVLFLLRDNIRFAENSLFCASLVVFTGIVIERLIILLKIADQLILRYIRNYKRFCHRKRREKLCVGQECIICFESLEGPTETKLLPCEHCFHDKCITRWLRRQNACPICRSRCNLWPMSQ